MADPTQSSIPSSPGPLQHDNGPVAQSNGGSAGMGNGAGTLSDLKDKIANAQEVVKTKYRVVSESTDDFVHDSPWKSVAMAFIGGLIIGMLAAR